MTHKTLWHADWEQWQTGGGCLALGFNDPDESGDHVMATAAPDVGLPEPDNDVLLGFYANGWDEGEYAIIPWADFVKLTPMEALCFARNHGTFAMPTEVISVPRPAASVAEAVERGKAILDTYVTDGSIPPHIRDFGNLHDFFDANMLGSEAGLPDLPDEEREGKAALEAVIDQYNEFSDRINEWLLTRPFFGRPDVCKHENNKGVPAGWFGDLDKDEVARLALEAMVGEVQKALGETDGGWASVYFSGDTEEEFLAKIRTFIDWHIAMMGGE